MTVGLLGGREGRREASGGAWPGGGGGGHGAGRPSGGGDEARAMKGVPAEAMRRRRWWHGS